MGERLGRLVLPVLVWLGVCVPLAGVPTAGTEDVTASPRPERDAALHGGGDWTLVPVPMGWPKGGIAPSPIGLVTAGGPGFLAASSPDLGSASRLFSSADGAMWTPVAWPSKGVARLTGLAAASSGIVAVGLTGSDQAPTGAAWFSPDGLTWTRVKSLALAPPAKHRGPPGEAQGVITGVAAGPAGFVAIGGTSVADCMDCGLLDPELWTSADGLDWHRIGQTLPDEVATNLVGGPAGYLLYGPSGAGLFSRDGAAWREVSVPRLDDVVATADGFAAVGPSDQRGEDWSGSRSVWVTRDGATWREAYVPSAAIDVAAIASAGAGVLVIGVRCDDASVELIGSTDGEHWEESTEPALAPISCISRPSVATDGRHIVVFGDEPALAWVSPSPSDPPLPALVASLPPTDSAGVVSGTWSQGPALTKALPITSKAVTLPDGRVLVLSGQGQRAALYDPVSDTWIPAAPRPAKDAVAAAAVGIDGRVYAFHQPRNSYGYDLDVQSYDPGSDGWDTLPQAPVCCRTGAAPGPDGAIYLFGEGSPDDPAGTDLEVVRFDPATGAYSTGAPFPGSAHAATPVAVQDDGSFQVVDAYRVWTYHPDTDDWTPGPRLPRGMLGGGVSGNVQDGGQPVALDDGRLLLMGRSCIGDSLTSLPIIIDPLTGTWWTGPPTPEPIGFALLARDGLGRIDIFAGDRLTADGCDQSYAGPLETPYFLTLEPRR
jgi:hypothetical protein